MMTSGPSFKMAAAMTGTTVTPATQRIVRQPAVGFVRPRRRISDAELADRIEAAPSRRYMDRPRPRADYVEHLSRFYDVLLDMTSCGPATTSWQELAVRFGYDEHDFTLPVQRYADALTEVGIISCRPTRVGSVWRLSIEVVEPQLRSTTAPIAQSDKATDPCSGARVRVWLDGRFSRRPVFCRAEAAA